MLRMNFPGRVQKRRESAMKVWEGVALRYQKEVRALQAKKKLDERDQEHVSHLIEKLKRIQTHVDQTASKLKQQGVVNATQG